ncbi:MAG: MFS transporter [Verrucomicrobia bacterium]|nr:MFS transporter [Verrucomicrobiota bacterium]
MTDSTTENVPETKKTSSGWLAPFFELNFIEMMERLAYNSVRVVAPIYIMQADNVGGLHLTAAAKGTLYAWWAVVQCFLPIITGGFADRYGYKKMMVISVATMSIGYLLMAFLRDLPSLDALAGTLAFDGVNGNYIGFLIGITVFATGSALFKPGIQGALSHTLPKEKSSLGWGVFYWVVNIGALIGHYIPVVFLSENFMSDALGVANSVARWRLVFIISAAMILVNFLPLLFFKDTPSGASKTLGIGRVLVNAIKDIFQPRLLTWILIMSGFWLMMFQLWDLQPNFLEDWVSSANVAATANAILPESISKYFVETLPDGTLRIPQAVLISANATFIILGVVGVSWITRKMRTLDAMIFGMAMATIGVVVAGYTQNAWFFLLGVLFFSLGEMFTGPKKSQYLSEIAPNDKKGVYLAYINIPVGVGIFAGAKLAGLIYGNVGEKATLALRYIAEQKGIEWRPFFDNVSDLEKTLGITRNEAMPALEKMLNLSSQEATTLLWDTYSPNLTVWLPFAAIGVVSAIALVIFSQMAKKWKDMNA